MNWQFFKIFSLCGLPILTYLLGSVPWGLVMTRLFSALDIRQQGSGNIGATNVARLAGVPLGLLTLALDMLKGAVPVYLAIILTGQADLLSQAYVSLIALAAFGGHLYPVYLKFKAGGKGVATAIGCFIMISPGAGVMAIIIFLIAAWTSKRVSAGSLVASAALPIAVWGFHRSMILTGCSLTIAVFIYLRHKDNIKRLLSGSEPPFRSKLQ
ncbi:MAG: glycerol-3-phosphate 1-O-acyltransferase PlsY [Desulfobacterales bacterium]|jgi:glycerol-3-phosphate acyltransferase PlsY